MTRLHLATLIALGLLAACAPTQRRLLAGHHYEEALAGAAKGELDGGELLAAIERDLEPGLHLQAVPASELRAHLGGVAGVDGVVLVRVIHDANQIPIDSLDVSLSLLHRSTLLPPIEPDRETLAAVTGEPMPVPTVTVTPVVTRYKSVGFLELFGRVMVNVATVGLIHPVVPILPSERSGGVTIQHAPGEAEYRAQIPVAEALRQWLQPPSCNGGLGQVCRGYLLWPRPQLGGDAPLELAVSVGIGGTSGQGDAAILYRLAIPPGALEGGLAAMFGDRQRTLEDLHRHHGRARIVVYPLDVLVAAPRGGFTLASRSEFQRIVLGTRKQPGLRAHPGLRFRIDPARLPMAEDTDRAAQVAELRLLLLSFGLSDQQIDILSAPTGPGLGHGLQVQYELLLPAAAPAVPAHP